MYEIILGRNQRDREKFGRDGTIFLGKHYITMGRETSLANPVFLDVVRPHVLLIAGKRGSGKSYTLGVIAEELSKLNAKIKENICCLIFDTLGIFWSMKYANYRDSKLLNSWELKPEKKEVIVFVPEKLRDNYEKSGIPVDSGFSIKTRWMNADDWCRLFDIDINSEKGAIISWGISNAKGNFSLQELAEIIMKNEKFDEDAKKQIVARFETVNNWGIFSKEGIEIDELLFPGKTSIIDISAYSQFSDDKVIKNLVVDIVGRQILKKRMVARKKEELEDIQQGSLFAGKSEKEPLVWIMIDEAHEFIPKKDTLASSGIKTILKEGRQPGISLVMATQQVGKLSSDALSQSDLVLSHRVTSRSDINALNGIMQSYLSKDLVMKFNSLPKLKGSAVIMDDNNEKMFPIQIRPRESWHGGHDPSAIKKIKESLQAEKENPFLKKLEAQMSDLKEMDD